ncbi:MAG: GAF domain-containing protein [Candidatus Hydrogenedentes bacterium]|nr:GAF domain-containing protein [Candidatus Hydrogenedentota bacterium]
MTTDGADVSSPITESVPWLANVSPDEMRRIVDTLYRTHRLISAITELDTLLERIMEESKQVANAEACSLMLFDEQRNDLYFQVTLGEQGNQQALKSLVRLKLNQGIAGVAAATRECINVPDVEKDERFYRAADAASKFQTRSVLAVPMIDREALVGVLEVVNKVGGGAFTDTDAHVMEMFSSLAATAIANARLIEDNLRAERLAAIGQAVAGLSHYTKNIITGMRGSADLIDQGLAKNNLDFLRQSWPIFQRSTRRISHLVEDMLAFSKPRKPTYEDIQLQALLDDVVQTFYGLLVRKSIQLNVHLEKVRGSISVDSRGIFSCLLNLMMNAADAVPATDGVIRVSAETLADGTIVIEIADNGPGIPEENLEAVFAPFFSTKGAQGTGLGLAVTKKIIAEHGGQICAGRAPEGGALFRLSLPVRPETRESA